MRFFASVALLVTAVAAAINPGSWENVRHSRDVDLTNGYVVETNTLQVKNTASRPQADYYFKINSAPHQDVKVVSIKVTSDTAPHGSLAPVLVAPETYRFEFAAPVAPNSIMDVTVSYSYLTALEAVPAKIAMSDAQFLVWNGNKLPSLYYPTSHYSLAFSGMSQGMELKTAGEHTPYSTIVPRVDGAKLVYGPITETVENMTQPMLLRYDHQLPLKHAHMLNRSVWLPSSPVGLVQFEEYYELANIGAQLDSGFSRLAWMQGQYAKKKHWSISWLDFAPTEDIEWDESLYYHTDLVGMVSTPAVSQGHLILQPRYPMFGGWNYNFTLGYEQSIGSVLHRLSSSANTYIAKIPLVNSATDMTYDDVTVNFYLPEGAEYLNVSSPLPYLDVSVGNELSYLDVSSGHVKVSIRYQSLTTEQSRDFIYLTYRYAASTYYAKLAKISGCVFSALAAYYLLGKVSLDISL